MNSGFMLQVSYDVKIAGPEAEGVDSRVRGGDVPFAGAWGLELMESSIISDDWNQFGEIS
jgi:hypothetical protein